MIIRNKEINHGSLIRLARFYDVSVDYLLCLSENRNHPDAELSGLHLSDEMVDLFKIREDQQPAFV